MVKSAAARRQRRSPALFFGILSIFAGYFLMIGTASTAAPTPPIAEQRPYTVPAKFGERQDPWYWLRDDSRENAQMIAYLEAENAYLQAIMAPQNGLQEELYKEIIGRLKQDDASVPYRKNGYWYYQRYETGKQYPIHARRKGSLDAAEEILIDGNERATSHEFYQLANIEISPDGRWAAVAEDTVGRRQYEVRIKDLETGRFLPTVLENVEPDLAWANDNQSLLYIRKDPQTLLGNRVYRHQRGGDKSQDTLVYEQTDDSFYMGVDKSKTDRFIYIVSQSTVSSEYWYADANDPELKFQVVLPRERDHEYQLEDLGDRFIIRTNWQAKNFRLVEAPIATAGDRSTWRDIIAHRNDAFIDSFDAFKDFIALSERSDGLQRIRIKPWQGKDFLLDAQDEAYTMALGANSEQDTPLLRYIYTSPTTPATTFDYDIRSGGRVELKREPVLGDFDSSDYRAEFRFVTARDGARVPLTLLYRKTTPLDGTAPVYQYAYGAYGVSTNPTFRSPILSLVDRGFIYAIAHVRGGQEMGREWYEQGKLQNKINTFNDFIDVTRYLVKETIADPKRVFGMGGSAGGLLIGAVANMAPSEYRGLIAHVPFVDVVTTMLDESIPLTTNEFDEWGNPGKSTEAYRYMLSYSPYDNVSRQAYPAMLVTSGLWDSQVQYFEPTKWVARLRHLKTNDNPLLLRTNMEAGHGGKSGRFERYREVAEEYAFVLWQAGLGAK